MGKKSPLESVVFKTARFQSLPVHAKAQKHLFHSPHIGAEAITWRSSPQS